MSLNVPPQSRGPSFGAGIRTWFLTGLVIAGPLTVTVYLVWWFIDTVDRFVRPLIPIQFWPDTYLPVKVPGTGVVLAFCFLTLLGFLTANFAGRALIGLGERILDRMPIVRSIYKSLKQIFETVFSQSGASFRKVGLVEFPTKGWWSVVFISAPPTPAISDYLPPEDEYVSVFMCCAPNPSTGFFFYMPRRDIIELPISVEEGAKLIMSCGLIQPEGQAALANMAQEAREKRQAYNERAKTAAARLDAIQEALAAEPDQPARSKRVASFFANK